MFHAGHCCTLLLAFNVPHVTNPADSFFPRQHPKKDKKGKGNIRVEHAEIHKQATLLEYLAGGLQISMTCAIDFTGECDGLS